MKKSKIVSLIMALVTVFSTATPVFANDITASNEMLTDEYSVMPISEVYDDYSTMLISENPVEQEIKVLLNDEEIEFADEKGKVTPQLINGRTMVPLRKIFELLGANVDWDNTTSTAYATKDDMSIKLQIGNEVATVTTGEETEEIILDSVPVEIDGRTLVPVRFISETLGLKVGWDEESQTVVIIDPSFVLEIVEKEAPIFYELITSNYEVPNTSEMKLTMDGNLKYANSEDKSSDSNIKMSLTGSSKLSEKAAKIDMNSKITGKGSIYEAIKKEGFEKITLSAIVDIENLAYYIKSSLLEEQFGKKWVKQTLEDAEEQIDIEALQTTEKIELEELVSTIFDYVEIDTSTYYVAQVLTTMLCEFVSDDYFTVSGRTTKTYTYRISLSDLDEIIDDFRLGVHISDAIKNAELVFSMKFKDNVNTESSLAFNGKYEDGVETIVVDFETKGVLKNINKTVNVTIPDEEDVVSNDIK